MTFLIYDKTQRKAVAETPTLQKAYEIRRNCERACWDHDFTTQTQWGDELADEDILQVVGGELIYFGADARPLNWSDALEEMRRIRTIYAWDDIPIGLDAHVLQVVWNDALERRG